MYTTVSFSLSIAPMLLRWQLCNWSSSRNAAPKSCWSLNRTALQRCSDQRMSAPITLNLHIPQTTPASHAPAATPSPRSSSPSTLFQSLRVRLHTLKSNYAQSKQQLHNIHHFIHTEQHKIDTLQQEICNMWKRGAPCNSTTSLLLHHRESSLLTSLHAAQAALKQHEQDKRQCEQLLQDLKHEYAKQYKSLKSEERIWADKYGMIVLSPNQPCTHACPPTQSCHSCHPVRHSDSSSASSHRTRHRTCTNCSGAHRFSGTRPCTDAHTCKLIRYAACKKQPCTCCIATARTPSHVHVRVHSQSPSRIQLRRSHGAGGSVRIRSNSRGKGKHGAKVHVHVSRPTQSAHVHTHAHTSPSPPLYALHRLPFPSSTNPPLTPSSTNTSSSSASSWNSERSDGGAQPVVMTGLQEQYERVRRLRREAERKQLKRLVHQQQLGAAEELVNSESGSSESERERSRSRSRSRPPATAGNLTGAVWQHIRALEAAEKEQGDRIRRRERRKKRRWERAVELEKLKWEERHLKQRLHDQHKHKHRSRSSPAPSPPIQQQDKPISRPAVPPLQLPVQESRGNADASAPASSGHGYILETEGHHHKGDIIWDAQRGQFVQVEEEIDGEEEEAHEVVNDGGAVVESAHGSVSAQPIEQKSAAISQNPSRVASLQNTINAQQHPLQNLLNKLTQSVNQVNPELWEQK